MGFRVCGQLFPYSYCLSYCKYTLAEYLYLCEVCRWMNTECSLCRFCLCLSYIICRIDVSILQIPFSSSFGHHPSFSAPFGLAPPFVHNPVIGCYSLFVVIVVILRHPLFCAIAKSLSPFGCRAPAPLFYVVLIIHYYNTFFVSLNL